MGRETRDNDLVDDGALGSEPDKNQDESGDAAGEGDEITVIGGDGVHTLPASLQRRGIATAPQIPKEAEDQDNREECGGRHRKP